MARRIGSSLPRTSSLPTSTVSQPKPPARASTLPASTTAAKPTATKPTATPPAATATKPTATTPAANTATPPKHAAAPEGQPSYSPWELTSGASDVAVSGGDNKLTAPAAAKQTMFIDKPATPYQKDTFGGGRVSANMGSAQASTTSHSGGGVHHYSAQAEAQGPNASFEWQKSHSGRMGVSSAQVTGEANTFKAQAQAGVSADTNSHAYTAALTAKAETGVGVTASANHDFNRHVGGYVKGEAKAGASAYAEGVATLDPKTATAMVSGQVGAGATAGAYATAGGHVGRVHGSVTAGAVAGASAQAGGKFGLENGFLKQSADVNTALGVGTHVKSDVAVDLRHHIKPGIASGLRPALGTAMGVPAPAIAIEPEKSGIEKLFAKAFGKE
ncbi:hypothetical protein HJC10_00865 [Corallococcus exiguus]|uniref:hypothetical protein n=1 Tax=Corallococcus TaxID=83461 RepID=UPI000EEB98D4|nr:MULTISPECIES: hypothetical protein [Corallococcus]NNB84998.1 hypothetical protein [Corallococcus exiguus]NNB92868.1 hypothetical protein [Corallococcus exiguus]NNC01409.1 hypothetical protein [Corallococcus exiguus]NPC45876.1 hypothetical protein [Corallococcus exiguus]RKH83299.1 hypothetical protein D7X99_12835 [Corallococcus sp. AB032C]